MGCSHTATGGRPKFPMNPSHMRFDPSPYSGRGCSCHTRKTPTVCPSHAVSQACTTCEGKTGDGLRPFTDCHVHLVPCLRCLHDSLMRTTHAKILLCNRRPRAARPDVWCSAAAVGVSGGGWFAHCCAAVACPSCVQMSLCCTWICIVLQLISKIFAVSVPGGIIHAYTLSQPTTEMSLRFTRRPWSPSSIWPDATSGLAAPLSSAPLSAAGCGLRHRRWLLGGSGGGGSGGVGGQRWQRWRWRR